MDFKAITFDLDGTLYPEYRILWPSLFLALRYPRFLYYFSRVRSEVRSVASSRGYRQTQAELLSKYLKKTPDECRALADRIVYGKWLDSITGMRPYAGLRDIILRLRKSGYKTAVLSDLPIEKKLSYLKLDGIWDCAFSSEETGHLKPHPSSFERLIKTLQVRPEEIIYIGNNYKYDVEGARQVGIKTGLLSARSFPHNQADYHFRRFSHLRRFLHSLLAEK